MSESTINRVSRTVRPDILRWLPSRWEEFIGNYRLIRHFKKLVRKIRRMTTGVVIDLNQLCFLLTGDSRSGKTAMVKFLVRCIVCRDFDEESLNPCPGTCPTCSQRPAECGLSGLNSTLLAYDLYFPRLPVLEGLTVCG